MIRVSIVLCCAAVAFGGCNEGNALSPRDMIIAGDLSAATDGGDDLSAQSPTCGQIVICAATKCMFTNLACDQMCAAGANQTEGLAALNLTLCAGQHCLVDGGVGGTQQALQCVQANCPMQIKACNGLPNFGG